MTVVFPIAHRKRIAWIDPESGEVVKKARYSPKTGSFNDAMRHLYSIRGFLGNERLEIKLLLMNMDEYRLLDGWSRDRKKGSHRAERVPLEICGECTIRSPEDLDVMIPTDLPHPFKAKDYTSRARQTPRSAWYSLKLLCELGLIEQVGKDGKAFLYDTVERG